MSPRTRWWLRTCTPAMPFLGLGVTTALIGGTPAVWVVALGAAMVVVAQVFAMVELYRVAYARGREVGIMDSLRALHGHPFPTRNPRPWDPEPEWPDVHVVGQEP